MRILDVNDNEISPSEADGEKGYIEAEKLIKKHFDAVPEIFEQSHLRVKCFTFTDGSRYYTNGDHDPRVKVIDKEKGLFEYNPTEEDDFKEVCGIDVERVIDVPYSAPQDEWDDIEYIYRYKLYTEAELERKALEELKEYEQKKFLERGQHQIDMLKQRIEQLEKTVDILMSQMH